MSRVKVLKKKRADQHLAFSGERYGRMVDLLTRFDLCHTVDLPLTHTVSCTYAFVVFVFTLHFSTRANSFKTLVLIEFHHISHAPN